MIRAHTPKIGKNNTALYRIASVFEGVGQKKKNESKIAKLMGYRNFNFHKIANMTEHELSLVHRMSKLRPTLMPVFLQRNLKSGLAVSIWKPVSPTIDKTNLNAAKKESGTEARGERDGGTSERDVQRGREDFDLGLGEGVEKVVCTINSWSSRH